MFSSSRVVTLASYFGNSELLEYSAFPITNLTPLSRLLTRSTALLEKDLRDVTLADVPKLEKAREEKIFLS